MAKIEVELTFPSELKDEPMIYYIGKNFNIIPNIVEASFSSDTGWAYLIIEGDDDEIERVFEYLRSKNIIVDKR